MHRCHSLQAVPRTWFTSQSYGSHIRQPAQSQAGLWGRKALPWRMPAPCPPGDTHPALPSTPQGPSHCPNIEVLKLPPSWPEGCMRREHGYLRLRDGWVQPVRQALTPFKGSRGHTWSSHFASVLTWWLRGLAGRPRTEQGPLAQTMGSHTPSRKPETPSQVLSER